MDSLLSGSDAKKERGQFFTVNRRVQEIMVNLLTPKDNQWNVLEPSAGAGDLLKATTDKYASHTKNAVGWELDSSIVPLDPTLNITYGNFFALAREHEGYFDAIIGNPPYVAWKSVEQATRLETLPIKSRYNDKVNLYYLFIDRCIDLLSDNGEMVMIVPKEWMYSTSATPLRRKLLENGRITHLIDGGEEKIFPDANVPAIIVFRYQKNPHGKRNLEQVFRIQYDEGLLKEHIDFIPKTLRVLPSGHWLILSEEQSRTIESWGGSTVGDIFSVRVGMITGADKIYNVSFHPQLDAFIGEGSAQPYVTTKGIEYYIDVNNAKSFNDIPPFTRQYLLDNKTALLSRRIFKFDETNWWKYGAIRNKPAMEAYPERIYTYAKTRIVKPFFIDDSQTTYFGGSLLALFADKGHPVNMKECLDFLNSPLFRDVCKAFGLTTSNKLRFQPSTLESLPFPPLSS